MQPETSLSKKLFVGINFFGKNEQSPGWAHLCSVSVVILTLDHMQDCKRMCIPYFNVIAKSICIWPTPMHLKIFPQHSSSLPKNYWLYSVTQWPVEFQWHWGLSSAEIRTINIHILMNLMIKKINLMDVILYMTVMTDISVLDSRQCYWNSTGHWVTE